MGEAPVRSGTVPGFLKNIGCAIERRENIEMYRLGNLPSIPFVLVSRTESPATPVVHLRAQIVGRPLRRIAGLGHDADAVQKATKHLAGIKYVGLPGVRIRKRTIPTLNADQPAQQSGREIPFA